jgi:hypothetical protein
VKTIWLPVNKLVNKPVAFQRKVPAHIANQPNNFHSFSLINRLNCSFTTLRPFIQLLLTAPEGKGVFDYRIRVKGRKEEALCERNATLGAYVLAQATKAALPKVYSRVFFRIPIFVFIRCCYHLYRPIRAYPEAESAGSTLINIKYLLAPISIRNWNALPRELNGHWS